MTGHTAISIQFAGSVCLRISATKFTVGGPALHSIRNNIQTALANPKLLQGGNSKIIIVMNG